MALKSEMAEHAAYFAMIEANQDHKAAQQLYDKWVPNEPVSKWKAFAQRCYKKFSRPDTGRVLKKGGRKPHVGMELALRIGTVYAQRLVWEHGKSRHFRDMDEVRSRRPRPCAAAHPASCALPALT